MSSVVKASAKSRYSSMTLAAITFLFFCSTAFAATLINGAGATFPYPLYSKWFFEFYELDKNTQINYQSIGSGGGIRQFLEKTVDFGATDSPMTNEQIAQSKDPILHIPTVIGSIVIVYNLPDSKKKLRLDSEVLADLFLGKVTRWNDPKIARLNPQVPLPNLPVILVRRSDGSGTTAVLTDYLSKISPEWKSKVGVGTSVNWPIGLGGKGNEGVSGLVKQTPGAIGYTELIYAVSNSLPYASLQNPSGNFVTPSVESATSAAASINLKTLPDGDFRVSITRSKGKDAYPISAFTYLLIYQKMPKEKGQRLVRFLNWAMTDGQKFAEKLYYSPLPPNLVKEIQTKLKSIELK